MMYGRQREDAIRDWNMQNEYNSPAEQMKRFKDAGLNPNLIYGQTTNAAPIRAVGMEDYRHQPMHVDYAGSVQSAADLAINLDFKDAQKTLMEQQAKVMQQEAILKAAQTLSTMEGTTSKQFDNKVKEEVRDFIVSQYGANLDRTRAETELASTTANNAAENMRWYREHRLEEWEMKRAAFAKDMQQAAEAILTARANRAKTEEERQNIMAQLKTIKQDQTMKELEIEMAKFGVYKGSASWFTALARALSVSKNKKEGKTYIR